MNRPQLEAGPLEILNSPDLPSLPPIHTAAAARRGKDKQAKTAQETQQQTAAEQRALMTWAQRLKRVFNIDIGTCSHCGGDVSIIASIEDPAVIRKILAHLDEKAALAGTSVLPQCRAPPRMGLFEKSHRSMDRLL